MSVVRIRWGRYPVGDHGRWLWVPAFAGTTEDGWGRMNLRLRESPWRLMLAVNAAVLIGVFWHKITLPPYVPYIHLLVDYHFGFTKRALIGAIVSLFTAEVPVWLVFVLSGTVWLGKAGLVGRLFL